MTPDPRELGLFLWRNSISERVAVGVFQRLRLGQLLRPEERQPLERFIADEIRHGDQLRACARQYLPARPDAAAPIVVTAGMPEPLAFAVVAIGERLSAPAFGVARDVFADLGDGETSGVYRRIVLEEAEHIAWGKGVLARIYREGGPAAEAILAYRRSHASAEQYRATRPDREWLVRR
jgi:hypothetical protein